MEEIPGIKKDHQMHDTRVLIQQYFGDKQNVIAAAQAIPSQRNNYLDLRQRGQIVGQEVALPSGGYSARSITGIQDRVSYGSSLSSIPLYSQGNGSTNHRPSPYDPKRKKLYNCSIDYLC